MQGCRRRKRRTWPAEPLPADRDLAQPQEGVRALVHDHVEQAGGQPDRVRAVPGHGPAQGRGGEVGVRHDHRGAAVQQHRPQFEREGVPGGGGGEWHHRVGSELREGARLEEARGRPVRAEHALWSARGPGGEEDARRIVGADGHGREADGGRRLPGHGGGRQPHGRRVAFQHLPAVAGDEQGRPQVAQHLPQPVRGPLGGQQGVGRPRLQDREERGDQLRAPGQQYRHQRAGGDARGDESRGPGVGRRVEFRVRGGAVPSTRATAPGRCAALRANASWSPSPGAVFRRPAVHFGSGRTPSLSLCSGYPPARQGNGKNIAIKLPNLATLLIRTGRDTKVDT